MDLLSLFNGKQQFERVPRRHGRSNSSYAASESSASYATVPTRPLASGTDYVAKYVQEENERALQAAKLSAMPSNAGNLEEMSVGTAPTNPEVDNDTVNRIYDQYNFSYRPQENLPIFKCKEEIVSTIETHSVTVIEGATGCGKSTQVPQFILDSCYTQRKQCNIVVTQPRRIAAISIADRVSKERNWPIGTLVGCQVGMWRCISKDTRLTYCTTGVLQKKLVQQKNMLDFTHIIIDEVHERDQDMDFLLLIIRKFLRTNSRQTKVILMSATFNVDKFSKYFGVPTASGMVPAPIVSIAKKRNYKVHMYYLCQLESLGVLPEISAEEPRVSEKMIEFCMKLINVFDDIDSQSEYDAEDLEEFGGESPRHATLVFLPGIGEIEEMHGLMAPVMEASKWDVVILHSSITHEEQARIFAKPAKGYRRVILSTNIAESSITIEDVKYVIDFCLTKQLVTDPNTNFQCLELTWASKANCDQRAGRAGRVMDGRVYRLIPKDFYDTLPAEGDPEIRRSPLENLVLQTKLLDMGEPKEILALAIDPPDLSNVERTVLLLKEAGGLVDKPNSLNRFDGEITDLGRIMAALPINIRLSKLIALGNVFDVLRDTIIMSAAMAVKSMFNNPFQKRLEAYSAKIYWADGTTCDCLTFLNAYRTWQNEIVSARFKKKSAKEQSWAERNFIQIKVMHEVDYLIRELTMRLERLGIKETVGSEKVQMDDTDRGLILKIVIAGAFYPNYFIRNTPADLNEEKIRSVKELGGLDPTRTVFLHGWKFGHPGKLYARRIQEVFKGVLPNTYQRTLVEFDGSQRVYVMFSDDKVYGDESVRQARIPGRVSLSVYKALKLRKLSQDIRIPILDTKSAIQRAEQLGIPLNQCSTFFNLKNYETLKDCLPPILPVLPALESESVLPIGIVQVQNPSKFWVHVIDDELELKLEEIKMNLNDPSVKCLRPVKEIPKIGSLVAAKWRGDKNSLMYRAVIENYYVLRNEHVANIFYIDFGYRGSVRVADLRTIHPENIVTRMPALALECTLSHIEPSRRRDPKAQWTREALEEFMRCIGQSDSVFGTVFSVVDSVVAMKVTCFKNGGSNALILNDHLVEQGLADPAEENYLSKRNNQLRENPLECEVEQRKYLEFLQYSKNYLIDSYPDPPPLEECRSEMVLRGPCSPLEISLSSLASTASTKKVNIDMTSVNSILLDTNPDDPYERMLVSAVVSQSPSGRHLTLRNTTLMPNIPGLAALLCLMFSPKIELRASPNGSHYIGALCGLGFDKNYYAPLLPEHDMEVIFDTEITVDDLQNINRLRHYMNMGILVKTSEIEDTNHDVLVCQRKVHDFLRKLLDRVPKYQKPQKVLNFVKWNLYDDSLFLKPTKAVIKEDSIYPLHFALQLQKRDEELEEMIDHLEELRVQAVSDPRLTENVSFYCKLCDEEVYGRESLRAHLFMNAHREREKKLNVEL
ncbi:hypothetical protein QAD02_005617 [Eretmocerus hayati]|uniref:Uncharacterized protein n=1 Tax=Eretmocerus hayati TaxID=131215 RepID=A0ACC2NXU7_9HYME|nr:hypothetical protein QAD02_005617 [Eretmocerus hayati]